MASYLILSDPNGFNLIAYNSLTSNETKSVSSPVAGQQSSHTQIFAVHVYSKFFDPTGGIFRIIMEPGPK